MWLCLSSASDCFVTKDDSQGDICGHIHMWALPQKLSINHERHPQHSDCHSELGQVLTECKALGLCVRKWDDDRGTVQSSGLRGRQPCPLTMSDVWACADFAVKVFFK